MAKSIDSEIFTKFRCPRCHKSPIVSEAEALFCAHCQTRYPYFNGKYPVLLADDNNPLISKEREVWNSSELTEKLNREDDSSYKRWVEFIDAHQGDHVLEVGCGCGDLLDTIKAPVKVGIELAANRIPDSADFQGIIALGENLPFIDMCFDLVLFRYTLHHVADLKQTINEAVRVLRPNGRLAVIEPNWHHPQRKLVSSVRSPFRKMQAVLGTYDPHESFDSLSEFEPYAESIGMRLVKKSFSQARYVRPSPRYLIQCFYSFVLKGILPDKVLYPTVMILLKK